MYPYTPANSRLRPRSLQSPTGKHAETHIPSSLTSKIKAPSVSSRRTGGNVFRPMAQGPAPRNDGPNSAPLADSTSARVIVLTCFPRCSCLIPQQTQRCAQTAQTVQTVRRMLRKPMMLSPGANYTALLRLILLLWITGFDSHRQ